MKGTFAITRRSPDWVSDFKTSPFNAYAWVELDSKPIGESINLWNIKRFYSSKESKMINITNLNKTYDDKVVLSNITFHANKGW